MNDDLKGRLERFLPLRVAQRAHVDALAKQGRIDDIINPPEVDDDDND